MARREIESEKPDHFPVRIGALFGAGIDGFRRQPLPLLAGGLLTLAVVVAFAVPVQDATDDEDLVRRLVLSLLGLVLAGAVAYPWFVYALRIGRGRRVDLGEPFGVALRSGGATKDQTVLGAAMSRPPTGSPGGFRAVLVCSFWFWAAILLGLQYAPQLGPVPALLVMLLYCFYGFVIADGMTSSGLKAMGTSVRLSQGRRVALFAIIALFFGFNFFVPLLPLGVVGANAAGVAVALAVFLVTSSITMVSGAVLFDAYKKDLPDG